MSLWGSQEQFINQKPQESSQQSSLLSASKFLGWLAYMMRQTLVLFKPPNLIQFPVEKRSSPRLTSPAIRLIATITIKRSNVCSSETGGSSHQGFCLRDSAKPFFYWSFLKNKHHSLPSTYIFYKDAKVLYSCRLLWTKFQLQIYKDLKICVVGCNTVDHQHSQIILNSSEFSMVHYLAQNSSSVCIVERLIDSAIPSWRSPLSFASQDCISSFERAKR